MNLNICVRYSVEPINAVPIYGEIKNSLTREVTDVLKKKF